MYIYMYTCVYVYVFIFLLLQKFHIQEFIIQEQYMCAHVFTYKNFDPHAHVN